jgi:hypothetical protein
MYDCAAHQQVVLMPDDESAEAVEPREESLSDPAPPIAAHAAAVVGSRPSRADVAVRSEELPVDARDRGAQLVGVVRLVGDDAPGLARRIISGELCYLGDGRLRERRLPSFAAASWASTGRPAPTTRAASFDPSPLLVSPMASPLFRAHEGRDQERLFPIEKALLVESHEPCPPGVFPGMVHLPHLQAAPTSRVPWGRFWQCLHCAQVFRIHKMPSRRSRRCAWYSATALASRSAGGNGSIAAHKSSDHGQPMP